MRTARALVAGDPLAFGRGRQWRAGDANSREWTISDDLRLFASTFTAGFLFVSILVA